MTARRRLLAAVSAMAVTAGCVATTYTSPTSPTATVDVTSIVSSEVVPGGSVSREFTLTATGRIAITLTSTSPPGTVLGVGLGIPRSDGSCALSQAVAAVAGATAQIELMADVGSYCARFYDLGTLAAPLPFRASISRP